MDPCLEANIGLSTLSEYSDFVKSDCSTSRLWYLVFSGVDASCYLIKQGLSSGEASEANLNRFWNQCLLILNKATRTTSTPRSIIFRIILCSSWTGKKAQSRWSSHSQLRESIPMAQADLALVMNFGSCWFCLVVKRSTASLSNLRSDLLEYFSVQHLL